jgi:putative FmdB family regulatory protein
MIYVYRCLTRGVCGREFELSRPVAERDAPAFCPDCGSAAERVVVMPQVLVPGHFRRHAHTTGLKSTLGSGPWESLHARRSRWDSGCK